MPVSQAEHQLAQFLLPVTGNRGDPDNLVRVDRECDVAQMYAAGRVRNIHLDDLECRGLAILSGCRRDAGRARRGLQRPFRGSVAGMRETVQNKCPERRGDDRRGDGAVRTDACADV